ncbi:MAG: hypothetical protein HQL21_09500 [Candidatus Omnitrophica bacterium]|nr:hypothetical protein [Candidatus Omnitrophota bacterium]
MIVKKEDVVRILVALTLMCSCFSIGGCGDQMKYDMYSSKDADINVTMKYPSGWKFVESKGAYKSFSQVTFLAPRDPKKKIGGHISLLVKDGQAAEKAVVDREIDGLIQLRSKMPSAKVVERKRANMAGQDAQVFEITYERPYKFETMDADLVAVTERMVVQKQKGRLYFFSFVSQVEDRDMFLDLFQRMLGTIKLK